MRGIPVADSQADYDDAWALSLLDPGLTMWKHNDAAWRATVGLVVRQRARTTVLDPLEVGRLAFPFDPEISDRTRRTQGGRVLKTLRTMNLVQYEPVPYGRETAGWYWKPTLLRKVMSQHIIEHVDRDAGTIWARPPMDVHALHGLSHDDKALSRSRDGSRRHQEGITGGYAADGAAKRLLEAIPALLADWTATDDAALALRDELAAITTVEGARAWLNPPEPVVEPAIEPEPTEAIKRNRKKRENHEREIAKVQRRGAEADRTRIELDAMIEDACRDVGMTQTSMPYLLLVHEARSRGTFHTREALVTLVRETDPTSPQAQQRRQRDQEHAPRKQEGARHHQEREQRQQAERERADRTDAQAEQGRLTAWVTTVHGAMVNRYGSRGQEIYDTMTTSVARACPDPGDTTAVRAAWEAVLLVVGPHRSDRLGRARFTPWTSASQRTAASALEALAASESLLRKA